MAHRPQPEEVKPLDMVIPDQYIDRTHRRVSTFFGQGLSNPIDYFF
ncbi:hypothetical protein CwatDRAFT_2872 [Crocosphaera watsonii WH 8501]|uniref:Uncharacterized protein n=1 Tax=Crocosphaera watsonii WH 8501 TaxID=165597 RepID=Q4C1U8_CROWT|nr:hypothetical protein CwatDRAFT_2872 [Crocosphaera watsonii WH 8501]